MMVFKLMYSRSILIAAVMLASPIFFNTVRAIEQLSDSTPAQDFSIQVATAVATKGVFAVQPETINRHFQGLVHFKESAPTPYLWQFTGSNARTGIKWAQADFQPSQTSNAWELLEIRLGFVPPSGDRKKAHQKLISAITAKLGTPVRDHYSKSDERQYWRLGPYWEIAVQDGVFESPIDKYSDRITLVEVAVLQGEEDEED